MKILLKIIRTIILFVSVYGLAYFLNASANYLLIDSELISPNKYFGYFKMFVIYLIIICALLLFYKKQVYTEVIYKANLSLKSLVTVVLFAFFYRLSEDPLLRLEIINGSKDFPEPGGNDLTYLAQVMILLNTVILSSFLEELVFRKIIFGMYFAKYFIFGIVISSLLFAVKHLNFNDPFHVDIITIFIFGALACFIYLRYGFWNVVAFHIAYNIIWLVIGINKDQYWSLLKLADFGFIYWIIVGGSLVIMLSFIYRQLTVKRDYRLTRNGY